MKVLQINVRLDSGSVARIVQDLYTELKKKGHECKVAFARGGFGSIPKEDAIRICSELEVKKHALLTRLFGRTAFYSYNSTKRFLKKVEEYNPDIVHIHGVYGYYINMKALFDFLKQRNIKVVSTLHSCWDFTGHCCHFDYIRCEQWKTCCVNCPQKSSYPKSSFLENTRMNYERKKRLYESLKNCVIVTPSKWLSELVKESFLNGHRIITIENGVDVNVFKKKEVTSIGHGIVRNKPTILCIANIWGERKGWKDVLDLSKILELKHDIQLVVVGVNNKQRHQLPDSTVCISRTTNIAELADIYNVATVLFNPTYEDTYPTVNIESIACGTPVITYRTGGSPEAVEHFNMGKVVKCKDYDEVIDQARKYYKLGKNNRNVSDELSYSNMTSRYLEVYNQI